MSCIRARSCVTVLPLVLWVDMIPFRSSSARAFCIVLGFTAAAAASSLTLGSFSPGRYCPRMIRVCRRSVSCAYIGLSASNSHAIVFLLFQFRCIY